MKQLIYLSFILIYSGSSGKNSYSKADSIAKNTKYKGDLNQLVANLTDNLETEMDKTRAIYFWITENIEYDYKKFNKGKQVVKFKCKTKNDCEIKKQEFESKLIEKVLRKKKGICSGYSALFKRMCDIAKINCLNIDGFVKTKSSHIGGMGILDHAWNAVIIDNQTYYLDLTWASGSCESKKNKKLKNFIKRRNDFYWFTPPEKFSVDHFPKNPDKILNFDLTKDQYKNQPYVENSIIPFLVIENPKQGLLKVKSGDSILFKFQYSKSIDKIQINTNLKKNPKFYYTDKNGGRVNQKAFAKQEYIPYRKNNNEYEFIYVVENENLKYIEIVFDYDLKLKYLVGVEGPEKKNFR